MADPLSIAGLALNLVEVVSRLHDYISSVKAAKEDIRRLSLELFGLKGALDHLEAFKSSMSNMTEMVKMTQDTLKTIEGKLGRRPSSFGKALKSLTWPFQAAEIDKLVAALERSKTFFIMVIVQETADSTSAVVSEMRRLTDIIHEDIISRKTDRMLAETDEMLRWLSPVNSVEEHLKASRDRTPGTCSWLMDTDLKLWYHSSSSLKSRPVFWVTGKSGSGKTTLVSSLVDELQTRRSQQGSELVACAFYYCSLDNAASQKASNVFRSILAQLANFNPEILDLIRPLYRPGSSSITLPELEEVLTASLGLFTSVYVVLNAFNETAEQQAIMSTMLLLCQRCESLRVFMTCTTDPVEESDLIHRMRIASGVVDRDIEIYVKYRLETEQSFRLLSPSIHEEIRFTVAGGADGTDMPSTLNETYAAILERIPIPDRIIAREALMWLSFAIRPMTLPQLAEAVVLSENDHFLDNDCRLNSPDSVLDICGGLVQVDEGLVTLSHASIRYFLTSDWIQTSRVAPFALEATTCHRKILRKCLTYLSFDEFARGHVESEEELSSRFEHWPLIDYAALFWPEHMRMFELDASDEELILAMFATKTSQPNGGVFESWVQTLLGYVHVESTQMTEPLYYAASYNMVAVLKLLLKPGSQVDINKGGGRYGSTPLAVACFRGNSEAAMLLLEAGADANVFDNGTGRYARRMAEVRKMDDVVKLMDKIELDGSNKTRTPWAPKSTSKPASTWLPPQSYGQ